MGFSAEEMMRLFQEYCAAKKYHEDTGRNFWKLSPTKKRKLIEELIEDSSK